MASDSTRIVSKEVRVIFPDGLPRGLDPSQVQLVVHSKADAPVREPAPQPVQPSECSAGPDKGSPAVPPNEPEPVAPEACPPTSPPAQDDSVPLPSPHKLSRAEAARENGRKSRGPVTPEGKARSSQNALKHGLSSRRIVTGEEDEQEWLEFQDECRRTLEPVGAIELGYADEFAASRWRLQRCLGIETSIFDQQFAMQKIYRAEECATMDGIDKTGLAFKSAKDDLTALGRYESRIRRSGERALANLQKLQSMRRNEPNQPDEPETPDGDPDGDMLQLVPSGGESPAKNEPSAPSAGTAPGLLPAAGPATQSSQSCRNEPNQPESPDGDTLRVSPPPSHALRATETSEAKRTQVTGHTPEVPLPSAFGILHSSSAAALVREPATQRATSRATLCPRGDA